mgnify:CR=1 FL=1
MDKFVITESAFSHSGEKKDFNFDFSKFEKFKNKIIYLKIEEEPKDLKYEIKDGKKIEESISIRANAIKRIAHQRNFLNEGIIGASKDDLIFYSDNDEIPNFQKVNLETNENKIIIFKQKLFYYKFNLLCDWVDWYGTKGCKKKYLKSFSWLREIKTKRYPFFRLDTFFSDNKYIDLKIIDDGGWHFSRLMSPKDMEIKLTNSEDHYEFKLAKIKLSDIEDLVKRNNNGIIIYLVVIDSAFNNGIHGGII